MFDENERMNCRDDFSAQCCDTAANEWKEKKRKKKEYDKCWWEISEDEYEKAREKEIREKEREFSICDVRRSRREEFKCASFHEVSH